MVDGEVLNGRGGEQSELQMGFSCSKTRKSEGRVSRPFPTPAEWEGPQTTPLDPALK